MDINSTVSLLLVLSVWMSIGGMVAAQDFALNLKLAFTPVQIK
jgi:hypothetical protein